MTRILISTGLAFLTILISACETERAYEFWDISKFRIDSTALQNNEEIKLLYTSRGPDNNKDFTYYIHVIAISQKTGDTVNILTTVDNGFTIDDQDKVFNFFDQNNIATKISQSDVENLKNVEKLKDLEKTPLRNIKKVARDPKFNHIADNNYPTVIGSIGKSGSPQ